MAIIVSVRALVVKDDKLLLVRGKEGPWHIPGGHLDEGESLIECAKREAYEETGYEVEVGDIVYCFEFFDKKWNTHKIECAFHTEVISAREDAAGWKDLGHDQSIEEQRFFSLSEIQEREDVKPACLKDGRWLEERAHRIIYHGKE
jgi:ADP-ribose pyrophosphatase YjhB (NUDIX family)